jgi:hypothetical protein
MSGVYYNNWISIKDLVTVKINPNNTNQVFAGSWSSGLLEFNDKKLTHIFDAKNSALDSLGKITVTGPLAFDDDNNLWVDSTCIGIKELNIIHQMIMPSI